MKRITKSLWAPLLAFGVMGGILAADSAGSGDAQYASPAPGSSDERIYCVGSVGKVYVTAAVMQLVEQGLVELDEPVTTYIPDFTMADDRYTDITVRMLMNHTSGILGSSFRNAFLYDDTYRDNEYLLQSLAAQRLIHAPGEYAAYCNDGFSLLELIVENMTGVDYTEYVVQNIASRVGAAHTGSPMTLFDNELNAPITFTGNVPYDYDYCMAIGAGGIHATASDVANFGSAFFTGNDVLLSRESQMAMATRWNGEGENADIYEDANGLGWDYVERLAYEHSGVTVLGKGGDITNQHAHLLVAPDQKISVAVLSSGGASMYNELVAEAILDVVLEEQGIKINHGTERTFDFSDEVPEEYLAYEGFYAFSSLSGSSFSYLSFDKQMMHVQHFDCGAQKTDDYRFLTDGSFVRVDEDSVPTVDFSIGRFEERDGRVYIAAETSFELAGLGTNTYYRYAAERINPNSASEAAASSWRGICGREMVLCNERYSSTDYDSPFACIYMIDGLPGYLYAVTGAGKRTLQIVDETHALAFTTMPCSTNRDLVDMELDSQTVSDGSSVAVIKLSMGRDYRFVDEFPVFDNSVSEISLHDDEPQWFVIGDDVAGSTIIADCPEDSVIYVYNKYHEVVYSTHMINSYGNVPLPEGGYIMFGGLSGGRISVD